MGKCQMIPISGQEVDFTANTVVSIAIPAATTVITVSCAKRTWVRIDAEASQVDLDGTNAAQILSVGTVFEIPLNRARLADGEITHLHLMTTLTDNYAEVGFWK